ncbi:phosphate/phosphite/phosphonate ABC transporter substrate-binding protein [Bacillus sp. JJ722]|uniref:phosphate/phosphite/phosphonate ABC transporter substrate-binding protein n=1 Tax=Bacillus sp. JJ722 TaxID=3122973 RepID=UPI002FFEA19F
MKKYKSLFLGSMLMGAIVLSGCSDEKDANAKGNGELEEFVIAYLPQESSEQKAKVDAAFEKDLEELLGVEVSSYQANSYNAAIEAMKNDKADLALFGAFSYIVANERAGAEAIAGINMDTEQPMSVFIVPKDSSISSLEDLKGKTIGFADPVSTSGHLMPKAHLIEELGVTVEELEKEGEFFKSVQFAGGHDKAVIGVTNKQYDVAAVSPGVLKMMIDNGVIKENSYKVIEEVPNIEVGAGGAFAIRGDHTKELKEEVKDFLLNYDDPAYLEALTGSTDTKLAEVNDSDFEEFRKVAESLNLSPEELLAQ